MKNTPEEVIEFMKAYDAAKQLEFRRKGQWRDVIGRPVFNLADTAYRVKAIPIVFYCNVYEWGIAMDHYDTKFAAVSNAENIGYIKTVKFVEEFDE